MRTIPSRLIGLAGVAALSFVGVACGGDDDPSTELSNPASVYCQTIGGDVRIVSEAGGEVGYCDLPDGNSVEEWELYRENHGGAQLANPAAVFCAANGGTTSGPEPMCELPDGTTVDAWQYYRDNA